MRFGCLALLALGLIGATEASAQVSTYAQFSASKLTNLDGTSVLFGPTIGVQAEFADRFHLKIGADLRGEFLGGSKRLDGLAVGPRFTARVKGFSPYGEFLIGLARYNDGLNKPASGTTDGQLDVVLGLDRKITEHFDVRIFDYEYKQYYALGGQFNPKTFSTGVVYHFPSR